jgi:glycosyltransferase involved in cell wall biosynthesis
MKFSILIANYNSGTYFDDCFASIQKQGYTDFEVIIVDDASTDGSYERIQQLIAQDSRFKLYQNSSNQGVGYTKKRFIDLASGSLCGILDADDFLAPEALEVLIQSHEQHPEASLIYSSTVYFDAQGVVTGRYRKTQSQPQGVSVIDRSEVSHFVTFKREMYLKSAGVNPQFKGAVDLDLYIVLEEMGHFIHVDHDLYYHRIHDQGISQGKNKEANYYWAFSVKNHHAFRKGIHRQQSYLADVAYFKYDLSYYTNWMLLKVILRRILNSVFSSKKQSA